MPERINLIIVLEGHVTSGERQRIVTTLLRLVRPWLGEPRSIATHQVDVQQFHEAPWEDAVPIPTLIPFGSLVHIFTEQADGSRGVLTIEQSNDVSSFTISVAAATLTRTTLDEIEFKASEILRMVSANGRAIVAIGPELEADLDVGTFRHVVRKIASDTALVASLIGESEVVPDSLPGFTRGVTEIGVTRLRHRYADKRIRGN